MSEILEVTEARCCRHCTRGWWINSGQSDIYYSRADFAFRDAVLCMLTNTYRLYTDVCEKFERKGEIQK